MVVRVDPPVPTQPLYPPPVTINQLKAVYKTRVNVKLLKPPSAFIIYSISYGRESIHVKGAYKNLSLILRSEMNL
ncbi:10012_t:CDS:2 [Cetraspora pellucida]|uniref:10012_t:CDS:1 n=1 Tax=Cetraspora pellucida TaxID=1433469 RepID=A0A9N9H6V9_9GLOM|nr:10012_t:CDS:2 [Cetraspora pellucida]